MKDIIIVGAGHLGMDVYYTIKSINKIQPKWRIKGFINDIPVNLEEYKIPEKIIGTIKDYNPSPDERFVVAIGSPSGRENVVTLLKSKGAIFETIISPLARVNETAIVGEGAVILSSSKIAPLVEVGSFAVVGDSTIAFRASLGDYSNTASYANIYQELHVGKRVQIWSHAMILNDVEDDAIVGAGSVVVKKVKAGTKVFGNPAKRVDL